MRTRFLTLAALALTMAGCSSNDENLSVEMTDTPIHVNASVTSLATKAGYEGTASLPESFTLNINSTNDAYDYRAKMKYEDQSWVAYDANSDADHKLSMFWESSTASITATAATFADGTLSSAADQSTEVKLKAVDYLMMAEKTFTASASNYSIDIELSHVMAKIALTITLGNEFTAEENPITDLTIGGTVLTGSITAGTWSAVSDQSATDITPCPTGYTKIADNVTNASATYEAIIVPQSIAANTLVVKFKVGERSFSWTYDQVLSTEKGGQYNVKLTAGNDKVATGTVTPSNWTEGQGGTLDAE